MKKDKPYAAKTKLKLRKEYKLFYWLNILYGTRKQIFLTFAPWVLVTIFNQKTQVIAILLATGGLIGIFFKPFWGRLLIAGVKDLSSARKLWCLSLSAWVMVFQSNFLRNCRLLVAFACYVLDQLLMSVGMARATYLQKIAVAPEDVAQTLTMGVTMDHFFSISVAIFGGLRLD